MMAMDALAGRKPGTAVETVCCKLRWKGMYIDAEPDPRIPNTRDGFCWCSQTMNCLGPDGGIADEGHCREGRGCFEAL